MSSTLKTKLSYRDWLDQVRSMMETKQDNDVTDCIDMVYVETKLNYQGLSDWVWFVLKTKQDNNVTNSTGEVYPENDIKLSWPIGSSVVCDKNKTRQQHDQLYKCSLRWKQYWTLVTD